MRPDLPWFPRPSRRPAPGRRARLAGLALAGLLVVATLAAIAVSRETPDPQSGAFGARVPGQRVYDPAGVFSPSEIAALDARASRIEARGVPVVVYIRQQPAPADDTARDAAALMDSWAVESAPGADDGLVLLLDVDDRQVASADVALVAGDRLAQGVLPEDETARIEMDAIPAGNVTRSGLAAGIGTGLAAAQLRLVIGAPATPAPGLTERVVNGLVRGPLAVVSLVLAVVALAFVAVTWYRRPRPADRPADLPATGALRAALLGNGVGPEAVAAGVRDLAHAGAVAYRDGDGDLADQTVAIHLVDRERAPDAVTAALWDDLAAVADEGAIVPVTRLASVAHGDGAFRARVEGELERQGLWDIGAVRRSRPLGRLGRVLGALGVMALALVAAVGDPIAIPAVALLLVVAAVASASARAYPRATALGLAARRGVAGRELSSVI